MDERLDDGLASCEYTAGYYAELNPNLLQAAFSSAGMHPPKVGAACELGFGVGLSVNIHAAATSVAWYGNDVNPTHAARARELAEASGARCYLTDETFAEFSARDDLPDFDYVGLHGILSWVSREDWETIAGFLKRKLKPGGVAYVSYNVMPGWADVLSIRAVFKEYVDRMTSPGAPLASRVSDGIGFLKSVLATDPRVLKCYPRLRLRIETLGIFDPRYMAHEYLCPEWNCIHFSELAQVLGGAGLSYACSATLQDHADMLHLTPKQRELLRGVPDTSLRETVRDLITNRQFRKEFWVKGPRKLTNRQRWEMATRQRVVMICPADRAERSVIGFLGKFDIDEHAFTSIVEQLADHRPRRIGELLDELTDEKLTRPDLLQAIYFLLSTESLAIAQEEADIEHARGPCARLNRRLVLETDSTLAGQYLASPVTGGGVPLSWVQQQFVHAMQLGVEEPSGWAARANETMLALDRRVVVDGKPAPSPEANAIELERSADDFARSDLPVLKSLDVC